VNSVGYRYHITVIVHFILWTFLSVQICKNVLFQDSTNVSPFGISLESPIPGPSVMRLTIVDFASHFNFVKNAWHGHTTVNSGASIFSLENQLNETSAWVNGKLHLALPFAYSPTMLWILAPLVLFSGYFAFCLFNIAGLLAVWWLTHPSRCRHGVGLLAFFSPLSQTCFALGQTALLTGAGLLLIAEKTQLKNRTVGWRIPIITGAILWALTAKPPLALTAVAVLLGLREWRPLLVALLLTLFSTLAITPVLGTNWTYDYMQLIDSYDLVNADPAYAWSLVPSHMANLRGVLSVDFGLPDDISSRISNVAWFISLTCIAAFCTRSRFSDSAIWSLGILSYLIFCSHVSSTEELQIVLLLPLGVTMKNRLSWQELVILITIPLLPFASPAIGAFEGYRSVLFIMNVSIVVFILSVMNRIAQQGTFTYSDPKQQDCNYVER